jgi:flagellar biosynthesis chaperone FliJ
MKILSTVLLVISLVACGVLAYVLESQAQELRAATGELLTANSELSTAKTDLVNAEFQLDSARNELVDAENELQSFQTQLTTSGDQLKDTESQLSTVESELTIREAELTEAADQYSALRDKVNERLGRGADSQQFITPDDENVSAKVEEITGGYSEDNNERWRDYERLYRWVVNNIEYNIDSYIPYMPIVPSGEIEWAKECWRTPAETLVDEVGDCEDMAVLLASLMLSYNNKSSDIWAIGILSNVSETGHLAVAFPVAGDKLTIFDPAGNYYTGINSGYLQSFDIDQAIDSWFDHWAPEMPDAEVDFVFSHDFFQEFYSTQEFIDWAKD